MSHVDPGPLASYESLADPNLTGYFNNSRMRRHLRTSGLINRRGNIVSEKVFRLNNARKDHQRHIRDVLAQAIIHKALDMERHRQMSIKQQLEKIAKVERVRKVRAERALRGDEDILPLLSPRNSSKSQRKSKKQANVQLLKTVTDGEEIEQYPQSVGYPAIPDNTPHNTRTDRMQTPYPNAEVDNQHLYSLDREALRSFTLNLSEFDLGSGVSPYSGTPVPTQKIKQAPKKKGRPATASGAFARSSASKTNARSLQLHRREPPMLHHTQIHTLCRVTFKYLGKMVYLDREEEDPRDTVEVMQQHCGGENLCVFKGQVMPGDNFLIISRRHRTFPFSLSFYLNGVQVERLSTCCEYKHKPGCKLGAKSSHFGIVKIEGSQPCFKCMVAKGKLKTRPVPTPPPSARKSDAPKRESKRHKKVRKDEPVMSDTTTTQDKSVEEENEVHHDAGKDSDTSSVISSKSNSTITTVSESEDEDKAQTDSEEKYSFTSDKKESSTYSSTTSIDSMAKEDSESDSTIKSKDYKHEETKSKSIKSSSSSSSFSDDGERATTPKPDMEVKIVEETTDTQEGSGEEKDSKKGIKSIIASISKSSSSSSSESSSSDSESGNKSKHESIVPYIKNKTTIDLTGKLLTNAQCDEFYSYLLRHPSSLHIEEVILKDCRLGDSKLCQLLKSFMTTKCLKILDLSNNNLTHNSCHTILEICLGNPVEILRLNNNPLKDKGIDVIMTGLIKSQRSTNSNVIEKKTAKNLVSNVLHETKKELGSEIDSQATSEKSSATSSVFTEMISLNKLTLQDIEVSKSGLDCVVDFIKLNPKLSFLNISGNALGKKPVRDLGAAVGYNYYLKNLEMNNCNFKDNTFVEFMELLKDRTMPINLSFKENKISDEGALKFYVMLTDLTDSPFEKLILSPGNEINSKIVHKIKKTLKK